MLLKYSKRNAVWQNWTESILVRYTYSLIALIKLALPLPPLPMIAMSTSTSRHFSSIFLKNSSMLDTALSSISFLSSAISARRSPMLNRDECSKWSSKYCGTEVSAVCSASSHQKFVSLLHAAPLTETQMFWICYDSWQVVGWSAWKIVDILSPDLEDHVLCKSRALNSWCEILQMCAFS